MSQACIPTTERMTPDDRATAKRMLRFGCISWIILGVVHAFVWGLLALPVYEEIDNPPALIAIGVVMGVIALITLPFFLMMYAMFFFFAKSHVLIDLLLGKVRVIRGPITGKRRRAHRPGSGGSTYSNSFLTVKGREYDTSLFSTEQLSEGQWVEMRVGRLTGVLCGVVPMR